MPITRLRDYFGEPIAFYYAWLGFVCKGVAVLSVPAVALWGTQAYYGYPLSSMMAIWCPVVVVWDTAWNLFWERKQNLYAECWDMKKQTEHMETRPQHRYKIRQSQVHLDEEERYYPTWQRILWKTIGWAITFAS